MTESFDGGASRATPTRKPATRKTATREAPTAPPYASESAARPPTVYAGRDGTPTVYFGPDGDEGATPLRGGCRREAAHRGRRVPRACVRTARAPRPCALPTPLPAPRGSRGTRRTCLALRVAAAAPRRSRPAPTRGRLGVDGRPFVPAGHLQARHPAGASSRAARGFPGRVGGGGGHRGRSAALGDPKKKGKHRRNSSLPTKEYLATLGFGGVGLLDEAFDLGGTARAASKEAEARGRSGSSFALPRYRRRRRKRRCRRAGRKRPRFRRRKNVGARLDSILSGIGKTPIGKQQNSVGSNHPPVGTPVQTAAAPSRHNRRGSTGLLLFDGRGASRRRTPRSAVKRSRTAGSGGRTRARIWPPRRRARRPERRSARNATIASRTRARERHESESGDQESQRPWKTGVEPFSAKISGDM